MSCSLTQHGAIGDTRTSDPSISGRRYYLYDPKSEGTMFDYMSTWCIFYPFMTNGISHRYQMDQSISVFKGCLVDFIFIFIQILIDQYVSKPMRP